MSGGGAGARCCCWGCCHGGGGGAGRRRRRHRWSSARHHASRCALTPRANPSGGHVPATRRGLCEIPAQPAVTIAVLVLHCEAAVAGAQLERALRAWEAAAVSASALIVGTPQLLLQRWACRAAALREAEPGSGTDVDTRVRSPALLKWNATRHTHCTGDAGATPSPLGLLAAVGHALSATPADWTLLVTSDVVPPPATLCVLLRAPTHLAAAAGLGFRQPPVCGAAAARHGVRRICRWVARSRSECSATPWERALSCVPQSYFRCWLPIPTSRPAPNRATWRYGSCSRERLHLACGSTPSHFWSWTCTAAAAVEAVATGTAMSAVTAGLCAPTSCPCGGFSLVESPQREETATVQAARALGGCRMRSTWPMCFSCCRRTRDCV